MTGYGSTITLTCGEGFVIDGSGGLAIKTTTLTIGTPILCLVFILVSIRCMVWCNYHRKKKRRRQADSDFSNANVTPNSCAVPHSSTEHPGNRNGDASSRQKIIYHIYHCAEVDDNFEAEMIKDSAGTNFRHLHDVIDQDSEYFAQYQTVRGNERIEQYMDMSGTVMKNIKKDVPLHPRRDTFAAIEKDTDENGYLVSSVSQRRVTGIKPHARCDTTGTFVIDDLLSDGPLPYGAPFIPSIPVGDSTRSNDLQSPVYEDIPSTFDRSALAREPQRAPKYWIIGKKDKRAPPPMSPNDPLYSVSIYPKKEREEREVDENGYLILETCAGKIVDERHVGNDKRVPTACLYKDKTSSEVDLHGTQNSNGKIKSVIYESIPDNLKL
ncbi:uncharacterized protein [Diadema setosum]|uniref:uncharacterized protein n=1 Tax=Diadema setosum TaxID=31175 RepID=UPI003B3B6876